MLRSAVTVALFLAANIAFADSQTEILERKPGQDPHYTSFYQIDESSGHMFELPSPEKMMQLADEAVNAGLSLMNWDLNRQDWPEPGEKYDRAKHFGSWLGLAPNNRVSGGRGLSRRTLPTANRAATALRVAAQSLHRSKSALGAFLRRKAAHLGMPKAITATAYKLARILYSLLSTGSDYHDPGQDAYERAHAARVVRSLSRRAHDLGYALVKREPPLPSATAG